MAPHCSRARRNKTLLEGSLAKPAGSRQNPLFPTGYHSEWPPANVIQAQRDCFGTHTYERIDEKGTFHTEWRED